MTKVTMIDKAINFKEFVFRGIKLSNEYDGVVQVGHDIFVLNGFAKKCSLLVNVGTKR